MRIARNSLTGMWAATAAAMLLLLSSSSSNSVVLAAHNNNKISHLEHHPDQLAAVLRQLSGEVPAPPLAPDEGMPMEEDSQDAPQEEATADTDAPEEEEAATDAPATPGGDGGVIPGVDIGIPPAADDNTTATTPVASDNCVDAVEVSVGDVIDGTTVGATEEFMPSCETFMGGNSTGVWYKIVGTGGGVGAFVNASFDVQMAVFTGTCDELYCLDGTYGDEFPFYSGTIQGGTEEGKDYYLQISGWDDAEGDYVLTIFEGEVPANTDCTAAEPIEVGQEIEGTTNFGRIPTGIPPCSIVDYYFGINSEAVFYSIMGTGDIVQFNVAADYDCQISIYLGDSCDDLTCVNANDDSPLENVTGSASTIAQILDEGQMYIVAVHGYEQASGSFVLTSSVVEPPENDVCESAIPLELGTPTASKSLAATDDVGLPLCGLFSNSSAPGIWYSVVGTGNTMQVTLNNTVVLHFSVYTGGCDALTCAGNMYLGFLPLIWDTVEGEVYSIYVYGRQGALSDTFDILAEEVVRPANDDCDGAIPLEVGSTVEGSTLASSSESDLDLCGVIENLGFGGVWYTFEGTGASYMVGLSSGGLNGTQMFDTQLSVYSGRCGGNLTCVDGNDQGFDYMQYENVVLFDSVPGETYLVYVNGFGITRGEFTLALIEIERPSNDNCTLAIPLELGDTVEGDTTFSTQVDDVVFDECGNSTGSETSSAGVWYSMVGGGFPVQVSVAAQYDVQLTVFSGTCDDLVCVDGAEEVDGDYFNAKLILNAEEGTTYYILVHGYAPHTGTFELFYETAITRALRGDS